MPKLTLERGGNTYYFHFSRHDREPAPGDSLDPEKIDALVLEEELEGAPQGRELTRRCLELGKPVYHVENKALLDKIVRREWHYEWGARSAFGAGFFSVFSALADELRARRLERHEPRAAVLSRRSFIKSLVGGALGLVGVGLRNSFDTFVIRANRLTKPGVYSYQEIEAMPPDVPSRTAVAERNAVMAEGLARLAKSHKRIGVVAGNAHYNLPRYLVDEGLRARTRGGYEPDIRQMPPGTRVQGVAKGRSRGK